MDQNTSLESQVEYDSTQPTKLQALLELEKVRMITEFDFELRMHL